MKNSRAQLWAKRKDTPATTGTNGEYVEVHADSKGRLWMRVAGDVIDTQILTGSTNGRPISVMEDDGSSITTVHTAPAGATSMDKVFLWISNNATAVRKVTIKFGGTSNPDDFIPFTVAPDQTIAALLGQPIQNSLVVGVVADGDRCTVHGHVERVTL